MDSSDNCGSSSFRLRSPSLNSVRLRRIFDMFDKNKDNIISVEELTEALGILGLQVDDNSSELESMIKSYRNDINGGGLRYEDFEALHRSLNDVFFGSQVLCNQDDESDLNEAFKVFDEDCDGYISAKELQIVLGKLGLHEEGREIERVQMMISSVDRNQDGQVDFIEFKDMMRNTLL